MIKLSKITDYAFVTLWAMRGGDLHSAHDLSVETSVPEPTTAKILKILARHGIVKSRRGVNGGYILAKSHAELSIGEVIEAFEGRIALTACIDHNHDSCALEGVCDLNGKWGPLNKQLRSLFYNQTLADMMSHSQNDNASRTYQSENNLNDHLKSHSDNNVESQQ